MKVILIENISSLGKAGDTIQVADGYARNFLIPKKKALPATSSSIRQLDRQRDSFLNKVSKEKEKAVALASKIQELSCSLPRPVGEQEKIFGSVTSQDIQEFLLAHEINLDRRKIILKSPIKTLGEFTIPIKLHPEVLAQLTVRVIPDDKEKGKS
jgi:large subunit ribosomal protein L9